MNHHPESPITGNAPPSAESLRGRRGTAQISPAPAVDSASDKAAGYYLLTGASGLVGRYLTRDLLASGKQLAVLARSNRRMAARDRIELLLQRWEQKLGYSLPRPVVLEGDVAQPNLGLSLAEQRWVGRHCTSLIHNAAVVKFEPAEQDQEPWQTNLWGTRNALEFARRAGLRDLHYVSTAYVCGNRTGLVREDELDCGQAFRNSYEESKFLAEREIMDSPGFATKTVYRPSIIAGDSQTGYTSSYHGLMWYLRLLATLVPQQPRDATGRIQTDIELPVSGDEPHNVITVDWVSRSICRLLELPASRDRTFHLVAETPTTFRAVIDWCCEYFNSTGVRFVPNSHGRKATSQFAEMFFSSSRVYQDYDACIVNFDNRNFRELIPDFPCPVISREKVIRYLEFGAQIGWGKRRDQNPISLAPPEALANRIASTWMEQLQRDGGLSSEATYTLDVRGISGGQWQFQQPVEQPPAVQPGLFGQPAAHLVLDTNDLVVSCGLTEAAGNERLQAAIAECDLAAWVAKPHEQWLASNVRSDSKKLTASDCVVPDTAHSPAFESNGLRLGSEFPAK